MPKFYLTTAIDYSNGEPHLGHALEKVGADCIARYRRLRGDAVHFLMGMDEHSQSVIQAAARAGVTPQAWVDRMAATFADYWHRLHCSNDDWIRTTEPRHARAVAALLERIQQHHPADLFEAEYEGLYCTGCEEFKTGAQIVAGGRAADHTLPPRPPHPRHPTASRGGRARAARPPPHPAAPLDRDHRTAPRTGGRRPPGAARAAFPAGGKRGWAPGVGIAGGGGVPARSPATICAPVL